MPGSKCVGLHWVPVYQWEEGRRKEQDGWLPACSDRVCGPAAMDSQHYEHQAWKHWKYRGCTYPKILNHVNYTVAPFTEYSCFIMKTEMNCDFRSSVLFVLCLFLSCQPPLPSYRGTQSGALAVQLPLQPCCSAHLWGCSDSGGAIHTCIHWDGEMLLF